MSSVQLSDDQHVRHIVGVLTDEFDGQLASEQIVGQVERSYVDLRESSRVESFVPILALRRARAALAAEASVAGPQARPEDGPVVEPAGHTLRRPGDVMLLVDGRFEVSRSEANEQYIHYYGHWLDDDEA